MDEETIKWILSDTTLDPVSKVPYAAVAFMLYYCLELKQNLLKTSENLMKDYPPGIRDFGETTLYLAGSAAQGFYLNTDNFLDARDVDIVAVYEKDIRLECEYDKKAVKETLKSSLKDDDQNDNGDYELCEDKTKTNVNVTDESHPSYLNVETWVDTYPGYVMLRKCRKNELPVQTTLKSRYVSSLETTRSRTEYWKNVLSYLGDEFHSLLDHPRDKEADVYSSIDTQGPSTTVHFCNRFLHICLDADLVYALRYPKDPNQPQNTGWPQIANKWVERIPDSGWPSATLKKDITVSGCLLVPKGHKGSSRGDYEWRVSFSLGELKLARSLNRIQRELVHVLKALLSEEQYQYGRAGIVAKLDSYFILNILFTESESIKADDWKEMNIAQLLFRLLEKLATSIKTTKLPHYFVEENNLLFKLLLEQVKLGSGEFKRGSSYEDVMMDSIEYKDFALYTVLRLRHDPLGQLLQQASYLRLPPAMHRAVFEPFVTDVKASSKFERSTYASTLLRLANAHLYMKNFEVANVYIEDAYTFLTTLDGEKIRSDVLITKAVCAYLVGNYDSAIRLFDEIDQDNQNVHSDFFEENQASFRALFARALLSNAIANRADGGQYIKTNSKRHLEKTLSFNFNPLIALELVNFFMVTGFYPEADELLMKIEDYVILEEDTYTIEPTEIDEASCIYYGEACAIPVIEEPIYVVQDSDQEDIENQERDEHDLQIEYQPVDYTKGQPENFEPLIRAETDEKEESMQCEPADFPNNPIHTGSEHKEDTLESHGILYSAPVSEENDAFTNTLKDWEDNEILSGQFDSMELTYKNELNDYEYENTFSDSDTDEQTFENTFSMLSSETDSQDLNYCNDLSDCESMNTLDSESGPSLETSVERFVDNEDQFVFTINDDFNENRPILDFHENQDLFNLCALRKAFIELGLHNDAERVQKRILDKVNEKQKTDKTLTIDALEHDLGVYMSNVEAVSIHDDWKNPFHIFKENVMFSTADRIILDEILKALVDKCSVVTLSVNDLYFHYRIQLAKYDDKTSEALDLIKHMGNENLKSIHFDSLGDNEEASRSSFQREKKPIYNTVSKWIKKLIDAVSRFEPRNTYLESVFT